MVDPNHLSTSFSMECDQWWFLHVRSTNISPSIGSIKLPMPTLDYKAITFPPQKLETQLGLSNELFKQHPNSIMWTFPMAEVKKVPQTDVATNNMKITSHKIPWDFTRSNVDLAYYHYS